MKAEHARSYALKLVHPESLPGALPAIEVDFRLGRENGSDALVCDFRVTGVAATYVNPGFKGEGPQWGLWDFDVVEVFLRGAGAATYYEFQVSPLNQFFELEIFEPRRRVNKGYRSAFRHVASMTAGEGWEASLSIPLQAIGWDGKIESITGNAFACLGPSGSRSYWSAFLPRQAKPDFHLPEYFRPLLK